MLPITDTRPPSLGPAESRPVLVLSHSFGFSRREWIEVSGFLAEQYRTVTIDMPGFGAAHAVPGYTMAEIARQFAEVIVGLGLKRYILVGHSMTGKVMSILASRAGKELGLTRGPEKLVLVTPTPLGKEVGGEDMRKMLLAAEKTGGMRRSSSQPTPGHRCPAPSKNGPCRIICKRSGPPGRLG